MIHSCYKITKRLNTIKYILDGSQFNVKHSSLVYFEDLYYYEDELIHLCVWLILIIPLIKIGLFIRTFKKRRCCTEGKLLNQIDHCLQIN